MAITALPTPPRRDNPDSFADDGDAFLGALPTFATEANALATEVNAAASTATGQAEAALAAVNAPAWVSGTTYSVGQCVYSPITHYSYRRKIAGAGTTDPSADATNWQVLNSGISASGTDTLTNKTIAYASNTLTGVQPTLVSGTSIKTVNSTSLLGAGNVALVSADCGHANVGSFVLAYRVSGLGTITAGDTVFGSAIRPACASSAGGVVDNGVYLSGTWRCLGHSPTTQGNLTLYQRIS